MAVAFALTSLGLGTAAAGLALRPSPAIRSSAAALLLAVASAYLMSRTSGVPGLAEQPEPFDTFGTTLSLVELVAAVVAVRQLNLRRHR